MNPAPSAPLDVAALYRSFNAPVTALDCGRMCAPHNPSGKPFCCDICHSVPVAYPPEWDYARANTDLWHVWRGDECESEPCDPSVLREETPASMLLLACKGPALCQRDFRSISCRQFPFFPYVTSDYRAIGLAFTWTFESVCWVISNLDQVTETYRAEFVRFYDRLFDLMPDELESYMLLSEEMREAFEDRRRRIPILHRNGGYYLLSPRSERLTRVSPAHFPRFGPYR